MPHDSQKVNAALADRTRYKIYQYVCTLSEAVSAPQMADVFGLHPNVARLHLNKLTEAGLLASRAEHTGRGGRPGFRYSPAPNHMFAAKTDSNAGLTKLLAGSLLLLGASGSEALVEASSRFALGNGNGAAESAPPSVFAGLMVVLSQLGLNGQVDHEGMAPRLTIESCVLGDPGSADNCPVCAVCTSLMQGVARACLDDTMIISLPTVGGGPSCTCSFDLLAECNADT